MRFWITKNSEVPVREQLVRQVVLGILSEDLAPGTKLPSVRALARRHQIHANTVSAAFHDLLGQGWLELRRGSGLYIRPIQSSTEQSAENRDGLDSMLAAVLQSAHRQGLEPEEVLLRLEHIVRPKAYSRILVVEPDPSLAKILQAEIGAHVPVPVETIDGLPVDFELAGALVAALPTRAQKIRRSLNGVLRVTLRLRSVRASLESQPRPGPEVIIAIASRSSEIRETAKEMLVAVGLDPGSLCEIDANAPAWEKRLVRGTWVVTDAVTARDVPEGCQARVFRVIADSSLEQLRQLCTHS